MLANDYFNGDEIYDEKTFKESMSVLLAIGVLLSANSSPNSSPNAYSKICASKEYLRSITDIFL